MYLFSDFKANQSYDEINSDMVLEMMAQKDLPVDVSVYWMCPTILLSMHFHKLHKKENQQHHGHHVLFFKIF